MTGPRLTRVDADQVPPQPWRNGGGATRTLFSGPAASPAASASSSDLASAWASASTEGTAPANPAGPAAGASSDDWLLRLSLADIGADGPFSAFPGVTRWFAVVEGPGVALDAPGLAALLSPDSAPLCFDGALAPMARLRGGPTRDLNLMLRGVAGGLWQARPGEAWRPPHRWAGLFCADPVWLTIGDAPAQPLPAFSLLHGWPDAAVPWRLAATDPTGWADGTPSTPPQPRAWWLSADLPALAPPPR